MLGHEDRDAQRTDRYVDQLVSAPGRGAVGAPADADADPSVLAAARRLRADLTRVHPSFQFEEALAERLATAAARLRDSGDLQPEPSERPGGTVTAFPSGSAAPVSIAARDTGVAASPWRAILPAAAIRRIPEVASRPSRPFIFGGVGVASAAISIGAVYVAWRHSRPTSGRMGRAVRAAHDRSAGSGRNRRSGATHGIFGVMS